MRCAIADWRAWAPGGAGDPRIAGEADPRRPGGVADAHWRRMGRLGRAVAACAGALLEAHPALDRATLPVVWGTALGEVEASSLFLDRLDAEGPQRVSPLVFQGSVYNAAVARLSLAMGLRGPAETVSLGQATALAALARGVEWLARAPAVLVIAGDEAPWPARRAYEVAGATAGEGAVALLVVRGEQVRIADGVGGPSPRLGRRHALPWESALPPVDADIDAGGIAAVRPLIAWLVAGRGSVVAADDGVALTASWTVRPGFRTA